MKTLPSATCPAATNRGSLQTLTAGAGARSPLNFAQLTSLRSAFLQVPDPRRAQSRRHPLSAMLTLIALIVRGKQSGLLTMPGYDALNELMNALDPNAYAHALTTWLQANHGILPRSLSLDGKTIGDGKCGMIVTLCRHEDGRPVAMIPATGEKEDCEVSEARVGNHSI